MEGSVSRRDRARHGGFPGGGSDRRNLGRAAEPAKLHSNPDSARIFLPNGKPPREGDSSATRIWRRAFGLIAEEGPGAFYKGEIAAAILKTSQSLGGTMTAEDLGDFSSEWVEPISIDYRGWRVSELPPNSQGIAALEMLNIMETSPACPDGPHSPAEMHKRIEAMKLAYADVAPLQCGPALLRLSGRQSALEGLCARRGQSCIDPDQANCEVPAGQPDREATPLI